MAAFVGHSGSGKSTIINMLPRLYDPQSGEVFIDDQNTDRLIYLLKKIISLSKSRCNSF